MERFYKISNAAYILGVCTKTIRRWDASGKIECKRTVGGHRRISMLEIERILYNEKSPSDYQLKRKIAIYSRFSSHEQKKKGDLDRQVQYAREYCREKQCSPGFIFQDVGSGLNAKRSGLRKLCKLVEKGHVSKVILTYSDRLTRFGFEYLKAYFASHGTTFQIINKKQDCSMQEELVQDLIAIITSFSGRVHGMRSHKRKHIK